MLVLGEGWKKEMGFRRGHRNKCVKGEGEVGRWGENGVEFEKLNDGWQWKEVWKG